MTQSPELAGGAGFTFADQVATTYLASLLVGANSPGLAARSVVRVALEQRPAGEPLDDLIVDAAAPDGSVARLSLQVKREITISAASRNVDFRAIVRDCWATLDKPDFREHVDRVGAAVGPSTAVGTSRDLQALAEFARSSAASADFSQRFAPGGSASATHRSTLELLQTITKELGRPATPEHLYRLLGHFVLIRFDTLHGGAATDPVTVTLLEQALQPGQEGQAVGLFDRLQTLARRGAGTARSWDVTSLRLEIAPWFPLAINRRLAPDVERLTAETRDAAASIADRIGNVAIARPSVRNKLAEARAEHSLVLLRGLPGSGKSVLLRQVVEEALAIGPALLLKADRLTGSSWTQYATGMGLASHDAKALLSEIAVTGTPTLFIDGLDRIDKGQRGIILDLLGTIERTPELAGWQVLATLRDSGVEPVRTWLPQLFDGGRMATVPVDALDDTEAQALAADRPLLQPLLFGSEPARTLVRRPFFAKILDEANLHSGQVPRSEVELLERWWVRGGFDADGGHARLRQRALLELVRLRALRPDAAMALDKLDTGLLPIVHDLIVDGVLEDTDGTHFVRFAHDIFFEWSFAQLLARAGSGWVEELKVIGEPPVIGRAVDLRAQAVFVADHALWAQTLKELEDPSLRSQWRRVWLLGPLNSPEFPNRSQAYDEIVSANDHALLRMALVWFQAQHVAPNVSVLDGSHGEIFDRNVRLRVADLLGWPDDFRLWRRFLDFIDTHLPKIPHRLFPHVLTLFEVWQNALADTPNAISKMIIDHASGWLAQLEARQEQRGRFRKTNKSEEPDPWHALEDEDEFERALRRLLLRAARVEADRVSTYLQSFTSAHPARSKTFDDIMSFAPLLSQTHARDLTDFVFGYFRRELPDDRLRREIEEEASAAAYREELRGRPEAELDWSEQMSLSSPRLSYSGPDHRDWETLSLEREPTGYFPASPLYQPYKALFASAPDEGIRLVRTMTNHAVEAWRQLHRLQPRRGTPIPLTLEFPWGRQTFWGGVREYLWSRGQWAPQPLASGYLALDLWALDQIEAGVDADTLIKRIVTDNDSIAVLGIAVNVAQAHSSVSPVSEALVSSLRLWEADVNRFAQEVSIRSTSQIGFVREDQLESARAVEALNTRNVRSRDIRNLATLHVLQSDTEAAKRVRAKIAGFAETPNFEVEEARNHPDARARANETARTFAAWGNIEHYHVVDVPDQPEHKAIVMLNPIADEPAIKAKLEDGQAHLRTFSLFHWAEKSFKAGAIDASLTIDDAIAGARSIDYIALFDLGPVEYQDSLWR